MSIEELAGVKGMEGVSMKPLFGPLWHAVTSTSVLSSISETSRFLPREFPLGYPAREALGL